MWPIIGKLWALDFDGGRITFRGGIKTLSIMKRKKERWGWEMLAWNKQVPASHEGEGNGTPLQCSCLENPRNGVAWWAAVYGVAQSWTRLKQLSSSSSSIILNGERLKASLLRSGTDKNTTCTIAIQHCPRTSSSSH